MVAVFVRRTCPASASISPVRIRQSVVLPAPFGPTRPMRCPRLMCHVRPLKTICPPKDLPMFSSWITEFVLALVSQLVEVWQPGCPTQDQRQYYENGTWASCQLGLTGSGIRLGKGHSTQTAQLPATLGTCRQSGAVLISLSLAARLKSLSELPAWVSVGRATRRRGGSVVADALWQGDLSVHEAA